MTDYGVGGIFSNYDVWPAIHFFQVF